MNGDAPSSSPREAEKITAIVCAAGKGSRAGFGSNKVLKEILGISVLERTICAPDTARYFPKAEKRDFYPYITR